MPQLDLTLAIDVGTGSVRAALVDRRGNIAAFDNRQHEQIVPHFGWSEQRPAEWWSGVAASVRGVLEKIPGAASRVAAVAVCGQMHGTVLIDGDGELVRESVPLWNDKRTRDLVEAFAARHPPEEYLEITGNPPAPAWPGFKLQWFQQHEEAVYRRTASVLMPKDYINFRLTGVRSFEITEASLSFLMDARTWRWSPVMLEMLGIDGRKLPDIRWPTEIVGKVTPAAGRETALLAGTPVLVSASDYPMALLGSGACHPGRGSDVTGTSSLATLVCEHPVAHPEIMNTATPNGLWGAFVIVDAGGDAMRWARRAFHENAIGYDAIVARAAEAPAGADGLFFLPFLSGERLGTHPNSRAQFFGLTATHGIAHLHRAVLEGVAFALRRSVNTMRSGGARLDRLIASGGGAKTRLWLQIKASMLGTPVVVPAEPECGVIGCAALAAAALGEFATPQAAADALVRFEEEILPDPAWQQRYDAMAPIFDRLYLHSQAFYDDLDRLLA
ncbi:MAG TPA: FGGY family carbohydrate kinase [Anaeromyxobacter sp.]|nr:FGGY family carbohydrate kinase [Anaeromyxobacter sp.]